MNVAITKGSNLSKNPLVDKEMIVRVERTGNFITLSIADEAEGDMLIVVVNDKVKRMLEDIL